MFEELYVIAYFGMGLGLLGIVMGAVHFYGLYLDKREHNVDNNMGIRNTGSVNNTFDPVGDNDWK